MATDVDKFKLGNVDMTIITIFMIILVFILLALLIVMVILTVKVVSAVDSVDSAAKSLTTIENAVIADLPKIVPKLDAFAMQIEDVITNLETIEQKIERILDLL